MHSGHALGTRTRDAHSRHTPQARVQGTHSGHAQGMDSGYAFRVRCPSAWLASGPGVLAPSAHLECPECAPSVCSNCAERSARVWRRVCPVLVRSKGTLAQVIRRVSVASHTIRVSAPVTGPLGCSPKAAFYLDCPPPGMEYVGSGAWGGPAQCQ